MCSEGRGDEATILWPQGEAVGAQDNARGEWEEAVNLLWSALIFHRHGIAELICARSAVHAPGTLPQDDGTDACGGI